MEREITTKQIAKVRGDAGKLQNLLRTLPDAATADYEQRSTDAALLGERIARRLRKLVLTTTTLRKPKYMPQAADALGITIERRGDLVEITLPMLLPKRRLRGSDILYEPLYFALERYAAVNTLPRFRNCVVCFTHVYDRGEPNRRVRDYDNLELKSALDAIAPFVLTDDSGAFCDACHSTELGDTDMTLISVMRKNAFPRWLAERHKSENYDDY